MRTVEEQRGELSLVSVPVRNDGSVGREERVEASFRESVRVILGEDEEINDIDDANAQVAAEVLLEKLSGGDDFLGELVSDTHEDDIRVDSLVGGVV